MSGARFWRCGPGGSAIARTTGTTAATAFAGGIAHGAITLTGFAIVLFRARCVNINRLPGCR